MSQYGTIYRLSWNTVPSVLRAGVTVPAQAMVVNIYDTLDLIPDGDTPNVVQLQADANPLVIKVINNDEDKFSPIRAKQAIIQFKSDLNQFQDSTTFADSPDNRWYIEITADGATVFLGFLMLTDIQQDHLPDPNTVVLTASDHLALLKDIPWTKDDLTNPTGKIRIAECLALALKKTGLSLPIVVINNQRHGSGQIDLSTVFTASNNRITPAAGTSFFFYEGQSLTISGTVSNNIPVTIGTVTETYAEVIDGILTNETVLATFTDTSSTGHFYNFIYLDAKTFEKEIGVSEDCNTVLTKILGEDCFLTQWQGKWYIMRIDEYDQYNDIYPATFDANGDFVSFDTPTNFNKSIGAAETRRLANADALRRYDRPHRFIKEVFKYQFPAEIICNIDFSRGDVITPPDLASADSTATYQLDCFTLRRLFAQPITSTAHITRKFVFGTEKERYATITPKTGLATPWDFLESSAVELSKGDRAEVSVDWKYDSDFAGGATQIYPMRIYLLSDAGDYWYWWHPTSNDANDFYWTNAGASEAERYIPVTVIPDDVDMTQWSTQTVNLGAMPATGKLYIGLNQGQQVSTGGSNQNINFQGLQLTYKPYINGSYQLFTGDYDQVIRLDAGSFAYNAKREKEVFIRDSPRKEFKGAMFFYNGIAFSLTSKWYTGNTFALGYPPDQTYMHPYGHIQSYAVWNQYRNANRIFSTSVLGLGSMWVDLIDKISLTDANPNTNNRYFLLISMEQNWKTGLWSGVFVEDYNTEINHNYDDTHSFAYTSK